MTRTIKTIIAGAAVALIAAAMCGCGPEEYKAKSTGSEQYQQKVQQGQPLYSPPSGVVAPGKAPGGVPGQVPPQTAPGAGK